ncbi:MAG: UDP-N-acetylmuramoyl-L-alanine--D-glutamate ligase, partial [Boseongicola sp.]|nr:UDP-N-acetylmuramoyl-L-alanine--D-glutamate ligase [Boseongicola sp.]
ALVAAASNVKKAYIIGRQSAEIALQLAPIDTEVCDTMERAVLSAAKDAVAGETVLLAPAGASFDQYDNFEQRGEDFIANVRTLIGG